MNNVPEQNTNDMDERSCKNDKRPFSGISRVIIKFIVISGDISLEMYVCPILGPLSYLNDRPRTIEGGNVHRICDTM